MVKTNFGRDSLHVGVIFLPGTTKTIQGRPDDPGGLE